MTVEYGELSATEERVNRFRQGVRYQTVSKERQTDVDPEEFVEPSSPDELLKLIDFIHKQYPVLHSSPLVTVEAVNTYSRLYTVRGEDVQLKPYLLAAHMDVVPVDESKWDQPPFEAELVDGEIYGRGTLDMKATLFAILETFEHLLSHGFRPRRTVYLAFGHDEESGGLQGARKIAELLKSRGVRLEFVLDEGAGLIMGALPGIDPKQKMAMISVAEKGAATVELSVSMPGGHSSIPARESSIGVLSRAVTRLESNPQPCMFGHGPEVAMLETAAAKMPLLPRFILNNIWLFGFLVKWIFSLKPVTDTLQRTTTAITMFHAGVKSNVIAQDAVVTINHRIHPAQTVQEVIDHDKRVIDDERVQIRLKQSFNPGKISPYSDATFAFQVIKRSVLNIHPDAIVVPNLLMANTDSRYYEPLSDGVYRFMPMLGTMKLAELIHGNNERIAVDNYQKYLSFYLSVALNANEGSTN